MFAAVAFKPGVVAVGDGRELGARATRLRRQRREELRPGRIPQLVLAQVRRRAAAGGVGSLAIQLAKMWGGKVIAVTSNDEKKKLAKELGAAEVIDADVTNLKSEILRANGGKPVDLVLEMVGGKTTDISLEVLAPFGRLIVYGAASRSAAQVIHPTSLMGGSKTVTGFWLAHCFGNKALLNDVIEELFKLTAAGKLKPIIGGTYPLSQATKAHQEMLARKTTGKITLDPSK